MKSLMFILAIVSSFLLGSCGSYQGAASSPATSPATYTGRGTVSGLMGSGLVLQDNLGNNLSVSTNGSFTFTTAIASGSTFNVTVFSQPSNPAQTCGVTAGASGTVASANVTSVVVTCIDGVLTGSMNNARPGHTATLLNNGQVLVTGGSPDNDEDVLASAELYDPATGTFTVTGSMNDNRLDHTATLLNNGKVLVTGGDRQPSTVLASAELYDPATGTFTFTGSMNNARVGDAATLLNNGQVLVTGGIGDLAPSTELASAELYDPATGTFTATGSMINANPFPTATLLNNGNVLVTGGNPAELYDPAAGTFTATGSVGGGTATLLNNGNVLIADSAELYLPSTLTPTGLVSITVTPTTPTVSVGSTQQFIATGTFSDSSMQVLQSVTWSSSNQAAVTITNDAGDHGVALALAAGESTITASAGSISGSTVLTVQ